MLVSAIIKAFLFYFLYRTIKKLLAYSETSKAAEGARYEYYQKQQAQKKSQQSGDVIDAEFKVIK
ncbi:hypothetical protein [Bacteriovorax sp. Seq25_V]|uniref:hypothetical protein n=1 Tax=Bacteriovorax sp. Seq25_V TaxID=1201288 RepID=UPI00038A46C6|nr:hypothetical protein [Bacteriovorax sp. Seq25_V]EQC44296.1 hypothetical protein M900_A0381 [Bacteriovorax sp. Seq25_V]